MCFQALPHRRQSIFTVKTKRNRLGLLVVVVVVWSCPSIYSKSQKVSGHCSKRPVKLLPSQLLQWLRESSNFNQRPASNPSQQNQANSGRPHQCHHPFPHEHSHHLDSSSQQSTQPLLTWLLDPPLKSFLHHAKRCKRG